MKDSLPANPGAPAIPRFWWVLPCFACILIATLLLGALAAERFGYGLSNAWNDSSLIGNVTRAYGTVKQSPADLRLETGRSLLMPLHGGDSIQTGEDSAAEMLFFGGSILQLEAASLVHFEDEGENVSIRLILGRGYFELPPASMGGQKFVFRRADGTLIHVGPGKRLILTLSTVHALDEAIEVKVVDVESSGPDVSDLELRYLAHGEEVDNEYPVLVPPILEDKDHERVAIRPDASELAHVKAPVPVYPDTETEVDVDEDPNAKFTWKGTDGSNDDPVIGYEVVVRPAFGYDAEDTARKVQTFKVKSPEFAMEKIGGSGTFLWTVRAVTASGKRGPASAQRWVEMKFPKVLVAPKIYKPKVE